MSKIRRKACSKMRARRYAVSRLRHELKTDKQRVFYVGSEGRMHRSDRMNPHR